MDSLIQGITVTPLKIIQGELGAVMHAMKKEEHDFAGFGEAYFSTVEYKSVKGWKKHSLMVLNFIVPIGKIRFVIYDDRASSLTRGQYYKIDLSPKENYQRLTVQPGLWVAFEGLDQGQNMLLNLASMVHDPKEAENSPIASGMITYPQL